MELAKVIDASPIFFQERISGEVDRLHAMVQQQEIHSPDALSDMIERINQIDVKTLPSKALEKFHTLCGRAHTLNINNMVDAIYEEASALNEGHYSSANELAKRTQTLKAMMADVHTNHSLSTENWSFLRVAATKLSQLGNQFPSSKIDDMIHSPHVNFVEDVDMIPKSEVKGAVVDPEWEDAELSFELFEVAQLLHEGKLHEATVKFRQLPSDIQEKLGSVSGSPDDVQAVVAAAYEIGRGDGYVPSHKEIELMFAEAPPCA